MKTIEILLLLHFATGDKQEKNGNFRPKDTLGVVEPLAYLENIFDATYGEFVDPASGLKAPIDFLENNFRYPITEEQKRYYIKRIPLKEIQFMSEIPILNLDPREFKEDVTENTNPQFPLLIDFVSLQSENINGIGAQRPVSPPPLVIDKPAVPLNKTKSLNFKKYFEGDSFLVEQMKNRVLNWTTCKEFKKRSVFHPQDLLNIDWIPFYTWCPQVFNIAVPRKFSTPTKKAVLRYKTTYGPYLSEPVDWNAPKLIMQEEQEALLIAADRSGMFHVIRDQKISDYMRSNPDSAMYPVSTLRMKIVDPYLAMMYCGDYFATIMAIKDQEPMTPEDKTEQAKVLNFTGFGYPVSANFDLDKERVQFETLTKEREESKYIKVGEEDLYDK